MGYYKSCTLVLSPHGQAAAAVCVNPAVRGTGSWWLRPGGGLVAGHQVGVGVGLES